MSYLRRAGQNPARGLLPAVFVAAGALMAVPRPAPGPGEARAARLEHSLRIARQELAAAIDAYRAEHGRLPGRSLDSDPGLDVDLLVRQLTHATDEAGRVVPRPEPGFPLGPYLPRVPPNPHNGLSTVRVAPLSMPPDGATGWTMDPTDGQVASNAPEEPR